MAHEQKPKRVLVAPLDWGLGHATRCIPVIRELLKRNCEVSIATSGQALLVLKTEFPELQFFELPSYQVTYSRSISLVTKIFLQLPKIFSVIHKEHERTKRIIKEHKIDLIISDNRFGCWSKLVPTVFLSHQTNILMPPHRKWVEPLINFFTRSQIKKFTYCWIPDFPKDRVTGDLTKTYDLNVKFIGMLSRFRKSGLTPAIKYDYVILLSGPEPQRTVLENLLRDNMNLLPGRKIMVKGQPLLGQQIIQSEGFEEVGHLQSEKLQQLLESSEVIISRSGYSTVMDLAVLTKKAFFIPTPGQTEQEYLAIELKKRKIAYYQNQKEFDITSVLQEMKNYTGFRNFDQSSDLLGEALDEVLLLP